jgi:streptomycin 3"-adenylyltransferase
VTAIALKNTTRLPRETLPVLEQHTNALHGILGDKLMGVYVHDSAAMGGFSPQQSDLDYLAVVAAPLDPSERRQLSEVFVSLHGKSGFRKGVEMSIVEARFAGNDFRFPTPYEFHMGTIEQLRHHGLPHHHEHCDPDLASFFTVVRKRGVCVFGRDIAEVFAPIDRKYFMRSNFEDLRSARDDILKDPVYVILNLCRTLAALDHDDVYSKIEGANLYLKERQEFRELVQTALGDYETDHASQYDLALSQQFAAAMLAEIEQATARS